MRTTPSPLPPRWLTLVLAFLFLLVGSLAYGADAGSPADSASPPSPAGSASHRTSVLTSSFSDDVSIDRATPRRALRSFLNAARDGDFTAAAHCLDPLGLADSSTGPELAEELSYVLYRHPPIDLAKVSDQPTAPGEQVTVDTFMVGDQEVPLILARVKFDDNVERWVFSRATVRRIPDIAATVRTSAWEALLPNALRSPVIFGNAPWQWVGILVSLFLAYAIGRVAAALTVRVGKRVAKRTTTLLDDLLVEAARRPLRTIFASLVFGLLVYSLQVSFAVAKVLGHVAYTGFVLGFAWLLLALFSMVAHLIAPPEDPDGILPDRAGARTRRALLQRVASAGIVCVTISILLLQFDVVRHVGLSLLASAGIAGVVLGLAAQKSLSGLIAGIQLSITQPIRLGDTVLLEGEAGRVEDIYLTYAVVRFWDDRCVVVPISRFLEQPFQNWTLLSREVPASVLIHVKFTAPIEVLRKKAKELCDANPAWDKKRCELQVSDSDMYGMILRVTISARSPAEAWSLRCYVREGLITFLQTLEGGVHMG